jgi:aldose 1-epimerase
MRFQVRREQREGVLGEAIILEDTDEAARVEVLPQQGFNALRWAWYHDGKLLDLLYSDTASFEAGRPTRSGIPVLFPFPNRIRAGRFRWRGREYRLPLNDSTNANAIHGFVCCKPWRVVDRGGDRSSAWVTGEFRGSRDAPEAKDQWPADYLFRLTYRLIGRRLRLEAHVENPNSVPLPFGLGYHPYFRIPFLAGDPAENYTVQVAARGWWELQDSLPTGQCKWLTYAHPVGVAHRFVDLQMDDVLTGLPDGPEADAPGLYLRGVVRSLSLGVRLRVLSSAEFREVVVFTPPHRQAVCLEPYTCITDAINLQQQGVDSGLLVLPPGEEWKGVVELAVDADSPEGPAKE